MIYCVELLSVSVVELLEAVVRFKGTDDVGVCISASILMLDTDFVRDGDSATSLLAQSPHENVSPTYAEPKDGGSERFCERANCWSDVVSLGYDSDAVAGIESEVVVSRGNGV